MPLDTDVPSTDARSLRQHPRLVAGGVLSAGGRRGRRRGSTASARRVRLWRQGRPSGRQRRIGRPPFGDSCATCCCSAASGAAAWRASPTCCSSAASSCCLIGTTLIAIEHVLADLLGREPTNPVFHKGVYFGVYELVTDTFRRRPHRRLRDVPLPAVARRRQFRPQPGRRRHPRRC